MIRRAALVSLAALVAAPAAVAGVSIRAVDTASFPEVRATLVAPLTGGTPSLREDGRPVAGYTAVRLGKEKSIVLALDRSQSMRGKPFVSALAAAKSFVRAERASDHVGVVAFGHSALAVTRFVSTPADAAAAVDGMTVDAKSGTALYDAVVLAANHLAGEQRPGRAIVVVTDGADVSSTHELADAVKAARAAHSSIYAIGIGGPSFTPDSLRALATQTGGSYRQVSSAAQLGSVYTSLAHELDRTWQLSYVTAARPGDELELRATVPHAGTATAKATIVGTGSSVVGPSGVIPGFLYSAAGTAMVALVAGLLVLLAVCFWFASRKGSRVRARIEPHLAASEVAHASRRSSRNAARTQVADSFERAFGNLRQFKWLQGTIDRADLPIRAGELLAMSSAGALFIGFVAAVAATSPIVILALMAFFGALPLLFVSFRAGQRIKRFDNQLPDILITIAASLKAGHSFRQGIQSVVEEGAEPAGKEFRRVLTETQLGKPMDDALGDMSARIGSKNLTFVINAVTIQRQIGGSLASLFDMVADTVRQRQQFARKVRGLTAMGRMSAYTLIGLAFFIGAVVTMMNPTYMSPLFHTPTGQKLVIGGLSMIGVGSAMLKKIVSFRG